MTRTFAAALLVLSVLTANTPHAVAQRPSNAAPSGPPIRGNSALLVLLVATDSSGKAREKQFIAELKIALDGLYVLGVDPGMAKFAQKPLTTQIVTVRELLKRHHGVAATWLSSVSPELVLLHVVVLSSGRALVRLVEGNPQRKGFVIDLAMAARELLGTAFLFSAVPARQKSLAHVVETIRKQAASAGSTVRRSPWLVIGYGGVSGGLAGYEGPSIQVGGGLAVERLFWKELRGRVIVDTLGGGFGGDPSHEIHSLVVSPGLGASYFWEIGPVLLGPSLDLHATWTNLWVQATPEHTQGFSLWGVRADIGPELRLRLGKDMALLAGFRLGLSPRRKVLTLQSTGETLYASPFLSWRAVLGVVLYL